MTLREAASQPSDQIARLVVAAYVVLLAAPFIIDATRASFWRHAEPATLTALTALLVIALIRRHRWAWVVLLVLEGGFVVSFAFDSVNGVWFVVGVVRLALLVSPPMRRYVHQPRQPRRLLDAAQS